MIVTKIWNESTSYDLQNMPRNKTWLEHISIPPCIVKI